MRNRFVVIPFLAMLAACSAPVDASDPTMAAGAAPTNEEHVDSAKQADSTVDEWVHFYNDGWYYAYADIYGYDANGNEIYHDWSGSQGHGQGKWFDVPQHVWVNNVPVPVSRVFWQVRMDPFGNTIHQQLIPTWYNFNEYCPDHKHATLYVGGVPNSTNSYDMHCSNW